MEKLQFDSFYKFIASLGVVLVAASVAVPYIYLKDPSVFMVRQVDYSGLIPESQQMVDSRMGLARRAISAVPFVSLGLLVVGTLLGLWAIVKWYGRQKVLDKKEDVEAAKAETELVKMTERQQRQKATVEAANTPVDDDQPAEDHQQGTDLRLVSPVTLTENYLHLEQRFGTALRAQLKTLTHDRWELDTNVVLVDTNTEFDAIVRFLEQDIPDVVFEVKVVSSQAPVGWVVDVIDRHAWKVSQYSAVTNRKAQGIILVFFRKEMRMDPAILHDKVRGYIGRPHLPPMKVEFIPGDQLDRYNYLELLK